MKRIIFIIGLALILIGCLSLLSHKGSPKSIKQVAHPISSLPQSSPSAVLGQETKSAQCVARNRLPDPTCTFGGTFQNATKEQICTPGYSKSVRNVPIEEKQKVYQEYGILSHTTGQFEIDHLISLELGGSNDISNLWPEAAEPRPGFHEKDMVENYLHYEVCNGFLSLSQAQESISTNWLQVYKNTPNISQFQYQN